MTHTFQFEADFADSLRCIPMQVRFNLDTCGVKLKLNHWNQLTQAERLSLLETSCATDSEIQAYRSLVHHVVEAHVCDRPSDLPIDPNPEWMENTMVPESVVEQGRSHNITISPEQWERLTPIQRFALIKLSRSNHENKNFVPALQEFGVIDN